MYLLAHASDAETLVAMIVFLVLAISAFFVYLLPSFVAVCRGHTSLPAIIALNILLGWTFLGWVAALVWSLAAFDRR